jgi:phosphosulfolactate phosphohydrolase-like enzyme
VLCAGEGGQVSLEDAVCAGLLVETLAGAGCPVEASDAATAARRAASFYATRLWHLAEDSEWARRLARRGRGADVAACLTLAGLAQVPELRAGAIEPGAPNPAGGRARPPGESGPAEAAV